MPLDILVSATGRGGDVTVLADIDASGAIVAVIADNDALDPAGVRVVREGDMAVLRLAPGRTVRRALKRPITEPVAALRDVDFTIAYPVP